VTTVTTMTHFSVIGFYARAPEGLTPKSVMVVILVTVHPMGCRGKRVENAGGGNQPLG